MSLRHPCRSHSRGAAVSAPGGSPPGTPTTARRRAGTGGSPSAAPLHDDHRLRRSGGTAVPGRARDRTCYPGWPSLLVHTDTSDVAGEPSATPGGLACLYQAYCACCGAASRPVPGGPAPAQGRATLGRPGRQHRWPTGRCSGTTGHGRAPVRGSLAGPARSRTTSRLGPRGLTRKPGSRWARGSEPWPERRRG